MYCVLYVTRANRITSRCSLLPSRSLPDGGLVRGYQGTGSIPGVTVLDGRSSRFVKPLLFNSDMGMYFMECHTTVNLIDERGDDHGKLNGKEREGRIERSRG